MVALAGARGVHERGAVRGQRRGHEDKDHEEEAEELFHISITAKDTISENGGGKQHKAMQRKGGETMEKVKELLMQQMELLHERAKKTRKTDELTSLTGSMRSLSAEIRNIEGKGPPVDWRPSRVEAKGANGEPLTLLK